MGKGVAMRRKILSGIFLLLLLALLGCSETSVTSSSQNRSGESVSSLRELGECNQDAKGNTLYVKDLAARYFCDGNSWKIIEDALLDVDGDKSSSSDKQKSSSSKRRAYVDDDEDETPR